jgi:hypothetical protein
METIYCPHGSTAHGFLRSRQKHTASPLPSLTFVDPTTESISALVHAVRSAADLVFLRANQDGLSQIARHLAGRGRLSSLHLLADLSGGRLSLCGKTLGLRELHERAPDVARIGRSIAASGQILIGAGGIPDGQSYLFLKTVADFARVAVRSWTDGGGYDR